MLSKTAARENVYTQSSQSLLSSSSFRISPPCAFIWTSGLPRWPTCGRRLRGSGWWGGAEDCSVLAAAAAASKWLWWTPRTLVRTLLLFWKSSWKLDETTLLVHVVLPGVQLLPPHQAHGAVVVVCGKCWRRRTTPTGKHGAALKWRASDPTGRQLPSVPGYEECLQIYIFICPILLFQFDFSFTLTSKKGWIRTVPLHLAVQTESFREIESSNAPTNGGRGRSQTFRGRIWIHQQTCLKETAVKTPAQNFSF